MEIKEHVSLAPLTTFGVPATARYFVAVQSVSELVAVLESDVFGTVPYLVLGGGSNVLFTDSYDGLIIKNEITGITEDEVDADTVTVRAGGGEVWHDLVTYAAERGLWGIENLALIPGSVGAAPIQNIGAYGVELSDVLTTVEAVEVATGEAVTFSKEACAFGYRDSIFKNEAKGKYIITYVSVSLSRTSAPNLTYQALREKIGDHTDLTPADVAAAVCLIRKSKLPDPKEVGNAGSFFKNPVVTEEAYHTLTEAYGTVPHFPAEEGMVKVPAAWLIEQCQFKGVQRDGVGSYEKQPLVLIRTSGTGSAVAQFAYDIQSCVREKFGITLHPEVTIIGPHQVS